MRKTLIVLAISLFVLGYYGLVESFTPSSASHKEFHGYTVKKIAVLMKRAGFNIVQNKIVDEPDLKSLLITPFYVAASPEALKKYFRESEYRFFAVETAEDANALYLYIVAYNSMSKDSIGRVSQYYIYYLRLDKKEFSDWQKNAGLKNDLVHIRNKIVFGLIGSECAARSKPKLRSDGKKTMQARPEFKPGLTASPKKFSSEANAFISLLLKELRNSYNIRFNVSESYPVVRLNIYEFPAELENIVFPMKNQVLLESWPPNPDQAKDGFKISNQNKTEEEPYFFLAELPGNGSLEKLVKKTARDIFEGFYLPRCPDF